ncbi:MAG TPA: hypothetical protein QGG47_13565 [Acidobacteriota bacterium]|nr:hypothetical protein [Acidobacteriota bacterium]
MRRVFWLWSTIVLLAAVPAIAEICAVDHVPAATLLLPYFEVDLNDPAGLRTESTSVVINNGDDTPAVVRGTLWTDLGVPIGAFDLFLTGYDYEEFRIGQIFEAEQGFLRRCGDGVVLDPEDLAAAFTGAPVAAYDGACTVRTHGDNVARGYLIFDVTEEAIVAGAEPICPSDEGYFATDDTRVARDDNVLTGESRIVHARRKYGLTMPLVAIEASDSDQRLDSETFYETYVRFNADRREPLGKSWGLRYYALNRRTASELIVWRDTAVGGEAFVCGELGELGENSWYPLPQDQIVQWDTAEDVAVVEEVFPFPAATQRVAIGVRGLPKRFNRGWAFLNLDTWGIEVYRQSFVAVRHKLGNRKIQGQHFATVFESACPSGR